MTELQLRERTDCTYDILALGEVMLHFDPGEGRIRTAREFRVWEGGGEYNVARSLRRCFGQRTALVTAFVDNEVGRQLEGMSQGVVDMSYVKWVTDDVGRFAKNGLNFTERGFGLRGAKSSSDRGHSAASQLLADEIDWDYLFGDLGVRWFHTGGIYAALSESTPDGLEAAMAAAKRYGTAISYDPNYRPSLWKATGSKEKAQDVNRRLAHDVDVMLGNEEDFTACLGFEVPDLDPSLLELEADAFKRMIENVVADYPQLSVVATTLRTVRTATSNDWGAIAWGPGGFVEATHRPADKILDRVGGGGGTIVRTSANEVRLGPDSVGYRIRDDALCLGGETLMITDVAVALGHHLGDAARVRERVSTGAERGLEAAAALLARSLERVKATRDPVPVVGGGSFIVPTDLQDAIEVTRPRHAGVANAIGAAMAEVSGQSDRVYDLATADRDEVLETARAVARRAAVNGGADPDRVRDADVEEIALAYLPGDAVRVRARAIGPPAASATPGVIG